MVQRIKKKKKSNKAYKLMIRNKAETSMHLAKRETGTKREKGT